MRILHYCLGFPPFRTGGMTKYCMDLMNEQNKAGHEVALLWPGTYKNTSKKCSIKKKKNQNGIGNYEIINPLPVPLLEGIKNTEVFMVPKVKNVFVEFFENYRFDVFHVHTLMGLPVEIIEAANKAGVKTIYTTHDYFGICPKCSLMQGNVLCTDDHDCRDCINCCKKALSIKKIRFLQSHIYKLVKNNSIVKKLRRNHIKNLNSGYQNYDNQSTTGDISMAHSYVQLRKYYINMLNMFNVIHFNSNQTKEIFSRYLTFKNNVVVCNISNSSISDNKKKRSVHSPLHFGYIGPLNSVRKGFVFLEAVLDELYRENPGKFELHAYQQFETDKPYIVCHETFSHSSLPEVMDTIDMLIVPSIWYETYGFTVLEALSYGVPVCISDNVGAKDIIVKGETGDIFHLNTVNAKEVLSKYINDSSLLEEINNNIVSTFDVYTMAMHSEDILSIYKKGANSK